MPKKALSQDIIDKIIALRKDRGLSSNKIAKELSLSPQTVTKYLKENGYDAKRVVPAAISPIDIEKMRRMRRQGYKLREISKEFGYSMTYVSFYTTESSFPRKWNRDNIYMLLTECDFNYTVAAKRIRQTKSNVSFLAKKFGFSEVAKLAREIKKKKKEKDDIRKAKDLHKSGLNMVEIAKEIHRSTNFVMKALSDNN
jgi:orotate phosphoribosyltransferase-like protein